MERMIRLINGGIEPAFFERARAITFRRLAELSGVVEGDGYRVTLTWDEALAEDGYRIEAADGGALIAAHGKIGVLSGIGRLLQEGTVDEAGFEPGGMPITFAPARDFYGTYFATHFGNYYMTAPLDEIKRYIEDLALWGQRLQRIWLDFHEFTGMEDPRIQPVIERLRFILCTGKELGMKIAFGGLSNEGFSTTPQELRAEWWVQGGYFAEPRGHYHVEICPSKAGGAELILKNREDMFRRFADLAPDVYSISVYDQGGCTCSQCEPYAGKAYLDMVKRILPLVDRYFPECRICIGGWYLDKFVDGEWNMMYDRLEREDQALSARLSYISGVNTNSLPKDIPENAARRAQLLSGEGPGGTRLFGFPEISMQGCCPWGGFGANPYPKRLQADWDRIGYVQAGMWSYSEGRFEDINKVIVLGLYSGRFQQAVEAMRAYAAFEFSRQYADEITEILQGLEETLPRVQINPDGTRGGEYAFDPSKNDASKVRFVIERPGRIEEIMRRVRAVDEKLPERIRTSWRWRLVYLRAMADYELMRADFAVSDEAGRYLEELEKIYHQTDETYYVVSAATRRAIARNYGRT